MTSWRDFVTDVSHTHTWMIYIPHLPRLMEYPEILSIHLPRPALVLQTRQDPLFTLSEAERCERILRDSYAKAKAADAFRMSFYDGPHKFDVPMQEEAFDWLARWLR
jgi:predicted esterase